MASVAYVAASLSDWASILALQLAAGTWDLNIDVCQTATFGFLVICRQTNRPGLDCSLGAFSYTNRARSGYQRSAICRQRILRAPPSCSQTSPRRLNLRII